MEEDREVDREQGLINKKKQNEEPSEEAKKGRSRHYKVSWGGKIGRK
jgi:hypothetical protein